MAHFLLSILIAEHSSSAYLSAPENQKDAQNCHAISGVSVLPARKKKDWGLIFEEVGGEGKQLQFKMRSFCFFFPLGHKVVLGQNCLLQKDFSGFFFFFLKQISVN